MLDLDVAAPPMQRLLVAARVALATLWLVWAAAAWWSEPRPADVGQLRDDLAAGHIVAHTRATSWQSPRLWATPPRPDLHEQGGLLVWSTSTGRIYYTAPDSPAPADEQLSGAGIVPAEDSQTARLSRELDRAGIVHGWGSWTTNTAGIAALLLVVTGIAILLGGPDPVRGTRWFWFWVGQLPTGLGYVAWLAWERPWTTPPPREGKRHNGWFGLGVLIVGGLAVPVLAIAASRVIGPWLVPPF